MLKLNVLKEVMKSDDVCLLALYDNGVDVWSYPLTTRFRDFCSWIIDTVSHFTAAQDTGGFYPLYFKFPDAYDVYLCGRFNLAQSHDCSPYSFDSPVKIGSVKEIVDFLRSDNDGKDL